MLLFSHSQLARLLLLLSLATLISGAYQYLFFPDIRHLQIFEWDPHYYRLVGTWLDPGFTGLIIVFGLIFIFHAPGLARSWRTLLWFLGYMALALTYSRASYFAFLISMAIISWRRRSLALWIGVLLLFGTTLILLPRPGGEGVNLQRTSTIQARLINWRQSWTIFSHHPVLGVGFNTYRYVQTRYGFLDSADWLVSHSGAGADSSILFVLATTGIVGGLVYLAYLRSMLTIRTYHHLLSTSLWAALGHSLFLNSLFYPPVLVWLGLLLAYGSYLTTSSLRD